MDWENLKTQLYEMVDDFIYLSKLTVGHFNLEVKDCFPYEGVKLYEGDEVPSSIIRLQINLEEKEG